MCFAPSGNIDDDDDVGGWVWEKTVWAGWGRGNMSSKDLKNSIGNQLMDSCSIS